MTRKQKCMFCDFRGSKTAMEKHTDVHTKDLIDPPKFVKNPDELLNKINDMLDLYEEEKIDPNSLFEYDYYARDYDSLHHVEKNEYLSMLVVSYNYLRMFGCSPKNV